MTMSKGAIGNLVNRYRAVLKKCHLINAFGSLAVAGMLVMGGAGMAEAARTVVGTVNADGSVTAEQKTVSVQTVTGESLEGNGVIYFVNNGSSLTVTGSTYTNNISTKGSGGVLTGAKNQATLKVDSTKFINNKALYDGGAISNFGYLTVTGSTFEGNKAQMADNGTHIIDTSDLGGGAIGIGSGSHVSIADSIFTGNISGKDGGAIATRKFYASYDTDFEDVGLTIERGTFSKNEAGKALSAEAYNYNTSKTGLHESGNGGALFNTFNGTVVDASTFTENSAINGGAIANFYDKGKTKHYGSITISNSEFSKNTAHTSDKIVEGFDKGAGGAVYAYIGTYAENKDSNVVISNSTFTENSAVNGGAIASRAHLEVKDGSKFIGNRATGWGGAIVNWKDASITGATFENNVAGMVGGAIGADSTSNSLTIASSVFKNNHAVYDGGAIGSYKALTITDSTFEGNTAQLAQSSSGEWNVAVTDDTALGGGAISLGAVSATSIATIENVLFKSNVSGYNGGAIATRMAKDANNSAAKVDIAATFTDNRAKNGGAIYNTFYTDNGLDKGKGVTVTGVFTGNTASENGGAIYNDGSIDKASNAGGVMTLTDSLFENNTAAKGGAIYNTGTLYFRGANTFNGNIASMAGNDIYNAGTVTVENGTTSLNSGYTQEKGSLEVAKDAKFNVAGLDLQGGTMTVKGMVEVAEQGVTTFGSGAQLVIEGGSFTADAGSFINGTFNALSEALAQAVVGTAGDLYLRLAQGTEYTASQYNQAKGELFESSGENAQLSFLNGTLKVEAGEQVVIGGTAQNGTAALNGVTPVVAKDNEAAQSAGAKVQSVPDKFVRVVKVDDVNKSLLSVSTLEVTGSTFSAKGLQVNPQDAQGVALNIGKDSRITLLGGETPDSSVIVDETGQAVRTSAEISNGGALTLGMEDNSGNQMVKLAGVKVDNGMLNVNGNGLTTTQHAYDTLSLTSGAKVNLSKATVSTREATLTDGALTVQKGADTSFGTLSAAGGTLSVLNSTAHIETLNASGGTLFVDPAYMKIDDLSTSSFGSALLIGDGSVVEIGSVAELQAKAAEAGLNPAATASGKGFTLASGQSMLALGKAVQLGTGGKIVVDAGVNAQGAINGTPVADAAYFGGGSLLVVDSAIATGGSAAIKANSTSDTITVKEGAKLYITDATAGSTYTVASGFADASSTVAGWTGGDLITNRLLDAERVAGADGSVTVTTSAKKATGLYPGISVPYTLDAMMGANQNSVNSANAGIAFLSRALEPQFLAEGDVVPTIDGAAQLAYAGGVQASTIAVAQAPARTIQNHLSLASNVAQPGTSLHEDGFDLWAQAIYGANRARDFSAGSLDAGYNSDFAGAVIGGDWTFGAGAGKARVGLAFNVGAGETKSRGDFNSTKNDFDFWGVSLYGGWNLDNLNVIADLGYSASTNELKQDIPSSLGLGGRIKGDVDSSVVTAGLKGEYMIKTDVLDVMPHVGVRYMAVKTDSFSTKLDQGGALFHTDSDLQHVWQFPVGVSLSKSIETESGWKVKPQADLSVVPAAGDTKYNIDVRTPGVNASDSMTRRVMDTTSFDGVFGVEVQKDNVSLGLSYNVQASEHQTGQGVTASFMYKF